MNKRDLLGLNLSGTICHRTGTRLPRCVLLDNLLYVYHICTPKFRFLSSFKRLTIKWTQSNVFYFSLEKAVSHGLHALTLEDIRYFFDPNAGMLLWQNLKKYFWHISGIFLRSCSNIKSKSSNYPFI